MEVILYGFYNGVSEVKYAEYGMQLKVPTTTQEVEKICKSLKALDLNYYMLTNLADNPLSQGKVTLYNLYKDFGFIKEEN